MANPEHLAVIKQGPRAWNEWRRQNPSVVPNFIEADLFGISFFDADLHGADLRGAKLTTADLFKADLHDANLKNADLHGARMTDANFSNAILRNAKCSYSNLRSADFLGANLSDTNLRNANLFHADFTNADLSGADLSGTDLEGVSFQGAKLTRATLSRAYLVETDFNKATMFQTVFAGVNLSRAVGLETVVHNGHSTIGTDTLSRLTGRLPEVFLRGCGVSEDLIRHLGSLQYPSSQFYSCFISYSHADKAFARMLHDRLQGRGIRCWLDEHQALPGDDLHEIIDQGIRLWDKVLLCASKSSLTSWWVDGEINRAFQKEAQIMKERGKKILALIPLNLDGFLFSDEYQSGKKSEIKSRLAANFVGWEKDHALFDRELEKVIRALRTDDSAREKPPQPKL